VRCEAKPSPARLLCGIGSNQPKPPHIRPLPSVQTGPPVATATVLPIQQLLYPSTPTFTSVATLSPPPPAYSLFDPRPPTRKIQPHQIPRHAAPGLFFGGYSARHLLRKQPPYPHPGPRPSACPTATMIDATLSLELLAAQRAPSLATYRSFRTLQARESSSSSSCLSRRFFATRTYALLDYQFKSDSLECLWVLRLFQVARPRPGRRLGSH